ncbi:hypothetical protein RJT34_24760 [Clitoria ternatea]|uniref:Uncharacterized protein n=1 Tax=Clitoria ternatea TaxID=43366 RepID=A0AAN9FVB4_CLITE
MQESLPCGPHYKAPILFVHGTDSSPFSSSNRMNSGPFLPTKGTNSGPFCHLTYSPSNGTNSGEFVLQPTDSRPAPLQLTAFSQFHPMHVRFLSFFSLFQRDLCMFVMWQACRISSSPPTNSNFDGT